MFNTTEISPEDAPLDSTHKKQKPSASLQITYQAPSDTEEPSSQPQPLISQSAPSLQLLHLKIQDTLNALSSHPGSSRSFYLQELTDLLCQCYGYSKPLIDLFLQQFSPNELVQYIESQETPRPITLRANTLKARRTDLIASLVQRGVDARPMAEWSKVAVQIYSSKVPLGATIEYLSGMYMLQSASSLLPVIALSPQPGERVLDMAAAPGGKTTYIGQLMKNQGVIVANDSKKDRLPSLKYNLQRMGVTNAIVTNYDGRKFTKILKGFDRVLLDAPCTGLGIISRDQSIKAKKGFLDVKKAQHLQKELILAAIDCAKPGGIIAYSTCSVTIQEDEWVIDYALRNRFVKVVDIGLELGEPGFTKMLDRRFNQSITKARRVFPHIHNMDGFFVCKLRKIKDGSRKIPKNVEQAEPTNDKQTQKVNKNKEKIKKQNKMAQKKLKNQEIQEIEEIEQPQQVTQKKKKVKKQVVEEIEEPQQVTQKKKKVKKQVVEEIQEQQQQQVPQKKLKKGIEKTKVKKQPKQEQQQQQQQVPQQKKVKKQVMQKKLKKKIRKE